MAVVVEKIRKIQPIPITSIRIGNERTMSAVNPWLTIAANGATTFFASIVNNSPSNPHVTQAKPQKSK